MLLILKHSFLMIPQDVVPDWQTAASGVLVAMGMKYCNEVMEQMLAHFKPGVLPHFFVVQTIANLSTANGMFITKTCPCNIQRFFSVVKIVNFQ